MTGGLRVNFCNLPDDILRIISEYCDLPTRCAVTCTNSTLKCVFIGSVGLTYDSSERFLVDATFRRKIGSRVVRPRSNLHLRFGMLRALTESEIEILNVEVRSVRLNCVGSPDRERMNQLFRIQTLTKLNLENLDLSNFGVKMNFRKISDISGLAGLTNLIHLRLSCQHVSDVSALAGLTKLTFLDLTNTQVSDVWVLARLTNLTHLDLTNTQVSDVSVLAGLKRLTALDLSYTEVSDLSALAGLTNLIHVTLIYTLVSDVSALAGLANLSYLDLRNTQVSEVSQLAGLKHLTIWR